MVRLFGWPGWFCFMSRRVSLAIFTLHVLSRSIAPEYQAVRTKISANFHVIMCWFGCRLCTSQKYLRTDLKSGCNQANRMAHLTYTRHLSTTCSEDAVDVKFASGRSLYSKTDMVLRAKNASYRKILTPMAVDQRLCGCRKVVIYL